MGDRANFGFVQPNGNTIVLYGHWAGNQMLGRLAEISDNEHKIAIIDWDQQIFSLHEEDDFRNTDNKVRGMKNEALFTMDLSTFCEKYALEEMLVN